MLYHRGHDTILQRFLSHDDEENVLNDSHSDAYGVHASVLVTAQKILFVRYFNLVIPLLGLHCGCGVVCKMPNL